MCALALVPAGCSKDEGGPTTPVVPPPALIAAVSPADRARGVQPGTGIWCEFKEPLDPATVTTTTVRLKVDTQRLTVGVYYEASTRRIHVVPVDPLDLRHTYTVELGDGIRAASGGALTGGYYWQFTTTSLRMPQSPRPMNGVSDESPFVLLQWSGLTEASAGDVVYELRVGPDSATVLDSTTTPLATTPGSRYLPVARWPQDRTVWWSVRARNLDTDETLWGRAWRFDCLPESTPSDTVDVPFRDNAFFQVSVNRSFCFADSIVTGNLFTSYYRWEYPVIDSTRKLASAMVELSPWARSQPYVAAGVTLWASTGDWGTCSAGFPGPPFVDEASGKLADAEILRPDRVRFSTDALIAHAEAKVRYGGYYGYVVRSSARVSWYPGLGYGSNVQGRLRLVIYRPAASARTAAR